MNGSCIRMLLGILATGLLLGGCGSNNNPPDIPSETGGRKATGGKGSGGTAQVGGSATGGSATGGSVTGGTATGGTATGGTPTGGTATGGTATGGTVTISGGTSSFGGTGTGGTCSTGNEGCACYGNNTCNGTLICASNLCVKLGTGGTGAGGTPSSGGTNSGGVPVTGGTSTGGTPASGGIATSGGTATGGTPPATGGAGGAVCAPEPPATPYPYIPMDCSGTFAATSNYVGAKGSWYWYADADNSSISSSFVVGAVPWNAAQSGMCINGTTSVDPTYAKWGAGIGVSLNQTGAVKSAYDATAKQATGVKVSIAGTLNGLKLRVAVTMAASTAGQISPYYEITAPGTYTIPWASFTCPTTGSTPCTPVSPSAVSIYDIQVQVVGADAAAAYSYCITSLEIMSPLNGGENGTGGAPGAGGAPATGGSPATGGVAATGGAGGSGPANSVTLLPGGYYQMPGTTYAGYCYTAADKTGSAITPPCGTGACFTPSSGLCVSGTAAKDTTDYLTWGTAVGCNLYQSSTVANDPPHPVTLPSAASINVTLSPNAGTTLPTSLRVKVTANDTNKTTYCGALTLAAGSGSVALTTLNTTCWDGKGQAFDPATVPVLSVEIDVVTNLTEPVPFNFCVSALTIG